MLNFNNKNMVSQSFPFRNTTMDYIYKNISASQLLKLYQTCKFFYAKFGLNIIEDFEICDEKDEERIVGNSLAIWEHNPSWLQLNNLWISKSFTFNNDGYYANLLQYFIEYEKFSRLTFSKLEICGGLDVKSFKFFVKCSSLRHLIVHGAIFYRNDDILSVEEIMESAPQVSTIDLSVDFDDMGFGPIDVTKLVALERQTKLQFLHVCDIPTAFLDPLLVLEFFKKHATPDIDYYFGFDNDDEDYDADVANAFYNTLNAELQAWKLSTQIPPTIQSSFIDLTGKTAVITGASSGIGKATVILFRQLGASVIAVGRNYCQMKDLFDECQNIKNIGFLHILSKSFNDDIKKALERIDNKFGKKFDILVNIPDTSGLRIIPNTDFEKSFCRGVLQGHYNFIRAAAPYLNKAKGCIINILMPHGLFTKLENEAAIAVFEYRIKHVVEAELVSAGIRFNSVNLGASVAALPRPPEVTDNDYKKLLENSKKFHELQAANSIAFLASDAAKLINGSTLNVNPMNLR